MKISNLFLILIALLSFTLVMGCETGTDDDSAGDDDADAPDPNAPVLSDLQVQSAVNGSGDCMVTVKWDCDDADGDLDGSTFYIYFDDISFTGQWDMQGTPPFLHAEYDFQLQVDGPVAEPSIDSESEYDVEVYMRDFAALESNHLTEDGYESPDENCY